MSRACWTARILPAMNLSSRKLRRILRVAGWNALPLMAGLVLIGLAGEAWLRSTVPFKETVHGP